MFLTSLGYTVYLLYYMIQEKSLMLKKIDVRGVTVLAKRDYLLETEMTKERAAERANCSRNEFSQLLRSPRCTDPPFYVQ